MEATLKTFVEDGEGFIVHVEVKGEVSETVAQFNGVLQGFKAAGYKANKGFVQNRGGGGRQQQQETPPPADLTVPEHCGQPMRYKQTGSGKGVFDCRLGAQCSTPREHDGKKYGHSIWESDIRNPAIECDRCGGPMWNNMPKKASGEFKANGPDYSCKNKECGGRIWNAGEPFGPASGERAPHATEAAQRGYDEEMPFE